ncbi:MAG TPA: Rrf2 family transcriptional regulator [Longimicrobiales bacterium]
MLTRTAEHALRAVLYLARQRDDRPVSAENVAQALGAPSNYLAKTLGALASAGIVRGRRGPNGGYRLLIPAERLTIGEIADLFEPEHGISACLLGGRACDPSNPCAAHFRWVAVREASKEPLRTTTIAELVGHGTKPAEKTPAADGATDDLLRLLYLA